MFCPTALLFFFVDQEGGGTTCALSPGDLFMAVAWPGSGWQSSCIWQQGGTLIEASTQTKF